MLFFKNLKCFLKVSILYLAAAYNVTATSAALKEVQVLWEPPTFLYPPSAKDTSSW